jgi:hypothetical protein
MYSYQTGFALTSAHLTAQPTILNPTKGMGHRISMHYFCMRWRALAVVASATSALGYSNGVVSFAGYLRFAVGPVA